ASSRVYSLRDSIGTEAAAVCAGSVSFLFCFVFGVEKLFLRPRVVSPIHSWGENLAEKYSFPSIVCVNITVAHS
uniref:Uncharacterized protein n=1 Tax=Anopheles minimus TaxID=112268 RepID=A0A182WQ98_9DIPT